MNRLNTVCDANFNRVKEALRVIEDILRFYFQRATLAHRIKIIRLEIGQLAHCYDELNLSVCSRDVAHDSNKFINDKQEMTRQNVAQVLCANYKRAQEALRVLEEMAKIVPAASAEQFKILRFSLYELELISQHATNFLMDCSVYLVHHDPSVLLQGIEFGASFVQLRDKDCTKAELYSKAMWIRNQIPDTVRFIINDDVDVALAVNADGVHIGQDDLPAVEVRRLMGNKIIGLSTHSVDQAQQALELPVDYIGVGPIYSTPTKPERSSVGLDYLDFAATNVTIPFVVIGGINALTINSILEHGGRNVGVVRAVQDIPIIKEKLERLKFLHG